MADATRAVDIIFRGTDQVSPAIKNIEASMGGISGEAADAAKSVDTLGAEVEDLGEKPQASVISLGNAMALLGTIAASAVLQSFIEANTAVEKFTQSIDYATGVSGSGAKEWEYISAQADKLGISVISAANAYSKFLGATTGTALDLDGARKIFEAVAGSISAVGGSSADVELALVQMAQGIGKNRFELEDLKSIADRIPGGLYTLADALGITTAELYKQVTAGEIGTEQILKYADALSGKLSNVSFDTFVNETERLKNSIVDLNIELAKSGGYDLITGGVKGATIAVKETGDSFDNLFFRIGLLGQYLTKDPLYNLIVPDAAKKSVDDYLYSMMGLEPAIGGTAAASSDLLQEIQPQGYTILNNLDAWEKYTATMDVVSEAVQKTEVDLQRIASNERIKNLEFKVELDIAQIEAQAKKTVAAFESISASITSTSDLLGSLFGDLNEADNFRDRFQIEDQIKLENERREEQLELQKRLTETQIRAENARIERMASGDAIININGDGLQPHLEAFMWEILEVIQVRVNADGLDMLLGAP